MEIQHSFAVLLETDTTKRDVLLQTQQNTTELATLCVTNIVLMASTCLQKEKLTIS